MSKGKIIRNSETAEFGMPSFETEHFRADAEDSLEDRLAQIQKEAFEQGYKEGEKAGYEVGIEKAAKLIEALEKVLSELDGIRKRVLSELEPQVFELSVAIAKRIIRSELTQNPDHIAKLIKEAMLKLERSGEIIIRVHPSFKEMIERHKPSLLEVHEEIKVEVDSSVEPSSPVVIGPNEEVITDYEVQITNLLEELGERINRDDNP
ncbi:MAG: hypothetical protein D6710_09980 [Nitrospirae bacterium]|nr:MAG: hypothetical protein D6710_09980 [Nitrospirota bacterium]